jgi:glutathione synthase/RimK-type ligase-like ATP-grasp enzyme
MNQSDNSILIITEEDDAHADAVVSELNRVGVPVIRLHPRDFPLRVIAALQLVDGRIGGTISLPNGRTFSLLNIRSAWYRHPEPSELPSHLDPLWVDFTRAQSVELLQGLWRITDCYWVSPPSALRVAENKLYQLQLASSLGLPIPKTLITNDPVQAREFYAAADQPIIYKPLATPRFRVSTPQDVIPQVFTTLLTDQHMEQINTIQYAPGIFQEYVPKQVELRITVLGRRVFAAEIHSQLHERTRHDWRRYPDDMNDLPHYPHDLPRALQDRLLRMVDLLGLQFGAIDMILTPNGEYIFLEINPNGQWLWVEDMTGLPMLETFVKMLVEGRPASQA